MIPVGDDVPNHSRPIVTYLLIGLTLGLFLWELKLEVSDELNNLIISWGIIPAHLTAVLSKVLTAWQNPAAWVLLLMASTPLVVGMFFHGSFAQVLGNLIFLFVFGKGVETALGHLRFLGFYLLCGVLTGVVQVTADPSLTVPLIGSNGVVSAVLAAYVINFPKAKIDTILPFVIVFIPVELPVLFFLFWWFVQQLFYGFGSLHIPGGVTSAGVAYWVHGVGMVFGAIFGQLMKRRK